MRTQGVPSFPNPVNGHIILNIAPGTPLNPDSPTFQAAQRACAAWAPQGGGPAGTASAGTTAPSASTVSAAQVRASARG